MRPVGTLAALAALLSVACTAPEADPRALELCPARASSKGARLPIVRWSDTTPELEPVSLTYEDGLGWHLVQRSWEWRLGCALPARERIGTAPALSRATTARALSPELRSELSRAVENLPRPFAKLFERHVCAVVPMHDAPMTGTLQPLTFDHRLSIVLLDVDKVNLPPNEWLAFKEATAFSRLPDQAFTAKMTKAGDNGRAVLLEFLLVHELGHVVDAAYPEHFRIEEFKSISWPRDDALVEAPLVHYPERKGTAPLPSERLEAYYDLIATKAFPSPAAASNPREDFADSLATFMHTTLRGRPWQLEVRRGGRLVRKLETCWGQPRCLAKRRILEALIVGWAGE